MEVEIHHCNNIDYGRLSLVEHKLNIKFAPNGTGKSTIARAIEYSVPGKEDALAQLLPFKLRGENPNNHQPHVNGTDDLTQIMCFNEEYVSQFTFRPDELVSNSFEILIKTEAYRRTEQEIESIISAIRQVFTDNPELETLLLSLQQLANAFKVTRTSSLNRTTTGAKALASGNKLRHIPPGLEAYSDFITSNKSVEWIAWQTKGSEEFGPLSTACCPYCSSNPVEKQQIISKVGQEYDKTIIKNLVQLIQTVDTLGIYFSHSARTKLDEITSLEEGLAPEHEAYIVTLISQIENLIKKLNTLKILSGYSFDEGNNVAAQLASYRLDLTFFGELQSDETQRIIDALNASLNGLIQQAGPLQGKLNLQRQKVKELIEKHQTDINSFLAYAGYRYRVQLVTEGSQSRLKLQHIDYNEFVSGGSQHLSYGERNAFAIVLFMYECLSKAPDLIVLDDPISSFDKNKKFAILEMLFRRKSKDCLQGKTVLMLTHDVEPIIDTLKAVRKQFNNQVIASYLRYSQGTISEQIITSQDIRTFASICESVAASSANDVIKLIYLRRYYEILDDLGDSYQVLSNLLHKRPILLDSREPLGENGLYPEMDAGRTTAGITDISKHLAGFDYNQILAMLTEERLRTLYINCQNGYEKLQVFRLLDIQTGNSVIQKFINETYHIENEFICQLDPQQFDLIPEYVISECDKLVVLLHAANEEITAEIA